MTFYELLDITQSVANRIDVQWGFFVTIHMALLGGVFFIDKPVPFYGKIAATFVYFVFAAANFRALRLQHRILERAYDDVVTFQDAPCCQDSALMSFFVEEVASGFASRMLIVATLVHLAAALVFVLSVFSIRSRIQSISSTD